MPIFNRVKEIVRTIVFAASPRLYGRSSSGAGDGEEISIGSGLTLTGGVLSATAAVWSAITGKPSTFPPDSHTHTWSSITEKPAPVIVYSYPPNSPNERKALGMITVNSIPSAGSTLTIDGHVFTFVVPGTPDAIRNIIVSGGMNTASVATSIASAIQRNFQTISVVGIKPPATPSSVELISVLYGTAGNATTFSSSSGAVSCDGSTLSGGLDVGSGDTGAIADFIGQIRIANGHTFICVAGGDSASSSWKRI